MTISAKLIISECERRANAWLADECNKQKEACAVKIREEFYGKAVYNTYWCAMFVWVVAQAVFGKNNPLLKDASTVAIRNDAKKKGLLRVDKTPTPGAVFFRTRDGGGHVGFVVAVRSDGSIITVEGNSSNAVGGRTYKKSDYTSWEFIHIEDINASTGAAIVITAKSLLRNPYALAGAGVLALGGGTYYAYKKGAIQKWV